MSPVAGAIVIMFLLMLLLASIVVWFDLLWRLFTRREIIPLEPWRPSPWTGWDVVVLAMSALFLELAFVGLARPAIEKPIETEALTAQIEVQSEVSESGEAAPPEQRVPSMWTIVASGMARVVWLAMFLVYAVLRTGGLSDALGIDSRRIVADVALGLRMFVAAILPVYVIQIVLVSVFEYESKHPLIVATQNEGGWLMLVIATVVAAILAPIFEELVFRRLLQGWLEKSQVARQQPYWLSEPNLGYSPLVIASLVFALLHAGHGPDPVAIFILSMFLGHVYRQTHRIIAPMTMHVCFNSLAMFQLWLVTLNAPAA